MSTVISKALMSGQSQLQSHQAPPLPRALKELNSQIDALESVAATLREGLHTVMAPDAPEVNNVLGACGSPVRISSPAVSQVENLIDRARHVTELLQSTIVRLEV